MAEHLPPGTLLVVGALLIPLLRGVGRQVWLLILPCASFVHLLSFDHGTYGQILLFDFELTMARIDKLSLVWGYIFHIMAFLGALYSIHVEDSLQHFTGFVYAGSAIAGAFAGALLFQLVVDQSD